jgi:hypothetical protein
MTLVFVRFPRTHCPSGRRSRKRAVLLCGLCSIAGIAARIGIAAAQAWPGFNRLAA